MPERRPVMMAARSGGQLAAVLPVDLVAVVLAGVVAGGDDHAGQAVEVAHREGKHRHGAQRIEQIRLHALRGEDERRFAGELLGEIAGIVADGHAALGAALVLLDQRRQRQRHAADGVAVHAVGAKAEHAAHAGGAEGQFAVEAVFELARVVFKGAQLFLLLRVARGQREPVLVFLHAIHNSALWRHSLRMCPRSCSAISRKTLRAASSLLRRASSR